MSSSASVSVAKRLRATTTCTPYFFVFSMWRQRLAHPWAHQVQALALVRVVQGLPCHHRGAAPVHLQGAHRGHHHRTCRFQPTVPAGARGEERGGKRGEVSGGVSRGGNRASVSASEA